MKKCFSRTISDLMMKYSAGVLVMGQLTLLPNISSLGFELAENKPLLFSIIFNRRTCYTIVYGGLSVWVTCPAVLRLQGPALKESSS
jgi:hypothetical protein